MRVKPKQALQAVLERCPSTVRRPFVIGLAGASAAGKSTLATALIGVFVKRGLSVAILHLDRYYRGAAERAELGAAHYDDPVAIDHDRAADDLARLMARQAINAPIYDFSRGERSGYEPIASADVVLVDGLFLLGHERLRGLLDVKLHFAIDADSGFWRRMLRDAGPHGRTKQSPSAIVRQFFREVLPAQRAHIDPTAHLADIIVEAAYDPLQEAVRAGPLEVQRKARGMRTDIEIQQLLHATLLGSLTQRDRCLVPKVRVLVDEVICIRHQGGQMLLSYKGPRIDDGHRHVSPKIEINHNDVSWLIDEYLPLVGIRKRRTIFAAGDLIVTRDKVTGLGDFIHISHVGAPEEGALAKVEAAFAALGFPADALLADSYLDLRLRT